MLLHDLAQPALPELLVVLVGDLGDAVGEQQQGVAPVHLELCLFVFEGIDDPDRQPAGFQLGDGAVFLYQQRRNMPGIDILEAMGIVIQIRPEEGREHVGCGVEIKMVVDLLHDLLAGVDLAGMGV